MEKKKTFVAVDVETLQAEAINGVVYSKLPIQIALIKYVDGKPNGECINTYICPPVSGDWCAHWKIGINSTLCKDAPTYDQLHDEIIRFVGDLPLIAFNSSTELGAFRDACAFYQLNEPFPKEKFIDPYIDCLINYQYPISKQGLSKSGLAHWIDCFGLYKDYWEEHDALCDAEMVVELYLYLQNFDIESSLARKVFNTGWFSRKEEQKDVSLFGDPIPESEVFHPENPFNRKYVCLTGFDCEIENAINLKLKFLGAGRLDRVKATMNILIPSDDSMRKYGCPPKGKIADALKKGKQIMNVCELKEILQMYGLYDGELE